MSTNLAASLSLLLSSIAIAQAPPGACQVDDGSFSTNQGGCQDRTTNVVWSTNPSSWFTWAGASNYCASLVEGGFSDWRLPTLAELLAADSHGAETHLADPQGLFGQTYSYWSSSTRGNKAYAYAFANGAQPLLQKTSTLAVYCVRNGLPAAIADLTGSEPMPHGMRTASQLQGGVWTTAVHGDPVGSGAPLFVLGIASATSGIASLRLPGLMDLDIDVVAATGGTCLQLDLRPCGLSRAGLGQLSLGMIVLDSTGPVLYAIG